MSSSVPVSSAISMITDEKIKQVWVWVSPDPRDNLKGFYVPARKSMITFKLKRMADSSEIRIYIQAECIAWIG